MGEGSNGLPRMMLGFVVRRCAVDLGHTPDPLEFASWANNYGANGERRCLFGRPISESEARIILKHQARLVSARSAAPHEQFVEEDEFAALPVEGGKVVCLDQVRARLLQPHKAGRNGSRDI
jgi:hypothetical protein